MKRVLTLILVLTLLVVTGTLVSADGKTRLRQSENVISNQFALDISRRTVSN
jgi:Tfp pilus assembly protein PilX